MDSGLAARLAGICGSDNVITDPQQLRTYECDGLTTHRCTPGLVVLPRTAGHAADIVSECAARNTPFVAPGSSTGLSDGTLPRPNGVLILTTQLCTPIAIVSAMR